MHTAVETTDSSNLILTQKQLLEVVKAVQTTNNFYLIARNPQFLQVLQLVKTLYLNGQIRIQITYLDVLNALVNYFSVNTVGEVGHEVHAANIIQTEVDSRD